MNITKNLNIQYLLILFLFISSYFGVALINLTIFSILIYFFFKIKKFQFDIADKLLLLLGIYFALSSILNPDYFLNSIIFLKFVFLFLGVKVLFKDLNKENFEKINIISLVIIFFIIFDLFYQKIFGEDIFGFKTINGERLTGPYKDKMIPGGIILYIGFYFIFYNYLKLLISKKISFKFLSFFILLAFSLSVLITGERMNFISVILLLVTSLFLYRNRLHIFFTIIALSVSFIVILNDQYLSDRYKSFLFTLKPTLSEKSFNYNEIKKFEDEIKKNNKNLEKKSMYRVNFFDTTWGSHYLTAYEMIKKKPFFGNGIKSYRDLCGDQIIQSVTKDKRCSTHPHNIHLEIISETGLVGYTIYLALIILILIQSFKIIKYNKNYKKDYIYFLFLSSLLIFIAIVFPFKSSGRFFSSFFGYLFWLNLSVLNGSIFLLKKKYFQNFKII